MGRGSVTRYTRCMSNEQATTGTTDGADAPVIGAPVARPAATTPLVILAADDDAVCVDEVCLTADARE